MKIHRIEYSGCGKRFLVSRLGARYGLPVYDLDDIYWVHNRMYGTKRSADTSIMKAGSFIPWEGVT